MKTIILLLVYIVISDGQLNDCGDLQFGKKFSKIDFGSHRRSVESSAENCRNRCKITNGCIGSSWWRNGGCHLSNDGNLVDASGVTASACAPISSAVCDFVPVAQNECPSDNGRSLATCVASRMKNGELCESDRGDEVNAPNKNNCGAYDVYRYECGVSCIDTFKSTVNAAISGHNREQLSSVSVLQCKEACCDRSWCKSFDYYKNSNKCDLSSKSASDVGGLKTNYAGNPYDHYSKHDNTNNDNTDYECTAYGVDTLNINGANRAHASFLKCGYDSSLTLKVDVKDILGIHGCPLVSDWIQVIECPGGVCRLSHALTMSFDVCDVIAAVLTAGTANLAAKIGGQVAKTAIGAKVKTLSKAVQNKVSRWAVEKAKKDARSKVKKEYKGMCQDIGNLVKSFLQCLNIGNPGDVIGKIAQGIGEILKVIGDLFGYLELKFDFGVGFNLQTAVRGGGLSAFQDWKTKLTITWSMGSLMVGPRVILTGIARVVPSVREGSTCDNWDTVASRAAVTINFLPKFIAEFKIGCDEIRIFGISLSELGNALKDAGKKVAQFMANIGNAVGEELTKFGEAFTRIFNHQPSSSEINTLKKVYKVSHRDCKVGCPGGWEHFATSDHGCCKSFTSCGGNRKWCRKKKKYNEFRRELGAADNMNKFEEELSLLESLASLSEAEVSEVMASISAEDYAEAEALRQTEQEEYTADSDREWIFIHPELTEEEQEEKVEELVRAMEPMLQAARESQTMEFMLEPLEAAESQTAEYGPWSAASESQTAERRPSRLEQLLAEVLFEENY